jgi:Flp pilus assembly pilin Flp
MTFDGARNALAEIHRDESGDIPIGPLLVIGLIVIPLVIGLITFGEEVMNWLEKRWGKVTDSDTDNMNFEP